MHRTTPMTARAELPVFPRGRNRAGAIATAVMMIACLALAVSLHAVEAPPAEVRAVFERYCMKCHDEETRKGDVNLEPLLEGGGGLKLWSDALEKLETGAMPPKSKPHPALDEQHAAGDWLTKLVLAETAASRGNEGRVVLRRLNRVEYEKTTSELLGLPVHEIGRASCRERV